MGDTKVTPKRYERYRKVSYYFDTATCRIHGKDKKGEKANSSDPVILPSCCYEDPKRYSEASTCCFNFITRVWNSFKKYYPCSQKVEGEMGENEPGWQSWYVGDWFTYGETEWKLVQDTHQ